jgi:hypothetical protein
MASQTVDRCRLWRAGRVSRFVPTSLASRHDSTAERAPDNTLFDARIRTNLERDRLDSRSANPLKTPCNELPLAALGQNPRAAFA